MTTVDHNKEQGITNGIITHSSTSGNSNKHSLRAVVPAPSSTIKQAKIMPHAAGQPLASATEVIAGKLYYQSLPHAPPNNLSTNSDGKRIHYFSIDAELVYWNFFLDFGPLNLGQLYRFCAKLHKTLCLESQYIRSPKSVLSAIDRNEHIVCYYSSMKGEQRANAIFLICAWQILFLEKTPEECFEPFRPHTTFFQADGECLAPLPPFHDATRGPCTYDLSVLDVLRGLTKARTLGFFKDFREGRFNVEEYEHFEMVENGDLNWIIDGQFLAFAGPQNKREVSREGYVTLTPEDYTEYFLKRNVGLVVRLNNKCYDENAFIKRGIDHVEHVYTDGSCPTKAILDQVVTSFEKCIFEPNTLRKTGKGVAVHCKAGLGRTGSCIGAFMMKHYKFTAAEAIGWMRLCRPGCVIGPQQHFLENIQQEMWYEGDVMRTRVQKALQGVKSPSKLGALVIEPPALDTESPELATSPTAADKKKRRSNRLMKLPTSGFKSAFHSIGGKLAGHEHEGATEGFAGQGEALRAAHQSRRSAGR